MMHHPYILEIVTYDRQNNLLREADTHRLIRLLVKGRPVQESLFRRIGRALDGLVNDPDLKAAKQGQFLTDRSLTDV